MLLYSHRPTAPSYALAESPRNYPSGKPTVRCSPRQVRRPRCGASRETDGAVQPTTSCALSWLPPATTHSAQSGILLFALSWPLATPLQRVREIALMADLDGAAPLTTNHALSWPPPATTHSFILHLRAAPSSRANGLSSQKCQDLSCRATYRFHLGRACDVMRKSTQSMTAGAWKCLEQI